MIYGPAAWGLPGFQWEGQKRWAKKTQHLLSFCCQPLSPSTAKYLKEKNNNAMWCVQSLLFLWSPWIFSNCNSLNSRRDNPGWLLCAPPSLQPNIWKKNNAMWHICNVSPWIVSNCNSRSSRDNPGWLHQSSYLQMTSPRCVNMYTLAGYMCQTVTCDDLMCNIRKRACRQCLCLGKTSIKKKRFLSGIARIT